MTNPPRGVITMMDAQTVVATISILTFVVIIVEKIVNNKK